MLELKFEELSKPFEESQIERTKASVTRKGYDTTGIKAIHVVNRLNELYGPGCFRTSQTFERREFTRGKSERLIFEVVCFITLEIGSRNETGQFATEAEVFSVGGHSSASLADAYKGALSNGFKKAASLVGVGKQAYEGTIDDDNVPADFSLNSSEPTKSFF